MLQHCAMPAALGATQNFVPGHGLQRDFIFREENEIARRAALEAEERVARARGFGIGGWGLGKRFEIVFVFPKSLIPSPESLY